MFNFGVQEVHTSKSIVAPGWAYVPDTGVNPAVAALQPSSRKRPRTTGPSSAAAAQDTTAKQDAKIMRELAALDRDNPRDVTIPVPVRQRDGAGRVSHGKVTPGVRKILQSAKTFANHLSDFEAFLATQAANPVPSRAITTASSTAPGTPIQRSNTGTSTPVLNSKGTRSHKKKPVATTASTSTPLRQVSTPVKEEPIIDTPMSDAPSLLKKNPSTVPVHPGDRDPLLVSRVPEMPSQEELEKLLAMPPLTYLEAKGPWVEEDRRKPVRRFCEVCGYWGRVKCRNCGGRVCALECLGVHQGECFVKYGA